MVEETRMRVILPAAEFVLSKSVKLGKLINNLKNSAVRFAKRQ